MKPQPPVTMMFLGSKFFDNAALLFLAIVVFLLASERDSKDSDSYNQHIDNSENRVNYHILHL